ncbi:MAG TPA: STAS domain-containing protein [Pyrinomonadaceae bacterium]|jgi:anti-sigma B factor antagonist|nr:STAS domain-containing protein [Pyrinomonadaceae bacterium]
MAELDVSERQAGDVTILDLTGEVRLGDSSVALRDSVRKLADVGKTKVLLNLAGVKYIDSSGIGELIANYTTVSRQGGQLKLLNLTDRIQNLLVITKLLTVFDSYDDEAEALKSFQ